MTGSPHPTTANLDDAGGVDKRRLRMPPEVGRGGRCRRNTGSALELRSGVGEETRGCRGSDDGLAGRPIALKHGVEESDRLGEESSARRSGDPERGLALQFNRFRNPYGAEMEGRKTTLIQRVGKTRNLCVDCPAPRGARRVLYGSSCSDSSMYTRGRSLESASRPSNPLCPLEARAAHHHELPMVLEVFVFQRD